MTVSLSSDWGLQGDTFNASLAVSGVTRATQLRLAPSWDKLNISRTEFSAARDAEFALTMAASQFYLYRLTVSCEAEDGDIADSVVMEVRRPVQTDVHGWWMVGYSSSIAREESDKELS